MKVIDHINEARDTLVSFEVLPPLKGKGIEALYRHLDPLMEFKPAFINVTYHRSEHVFKKNADGSFHKVIVRKRPGTESICAAIMNKYTVDTVPHLICGGFSVNDTEDALINLHYLGIDNVLVLRGDPAKNETAFEPEPGGHKYASDLLHQVVNLNSGIYLEMYNASEGFFAAQDIPGKEGMLLFTDHGIFLEFMPVHEYGKSDPQTVGLPDVETGKNYAPVISTNGGLWRYLLGDTIQFTSLKPYRIIVSGRLKHFINAFGEELIVDNTDKAIAMASQKTGAVVNDYTAAPIYFSEGANGAHEWLIEFDKEPEDLESFTKELDDALKSINSDYEAKRHKNIALRLPQIKILKKGSFTEWLRSKGKLGGQHKVPRLSNERTFVEEILFLDKNYIC